MEKLNENIKKGVRSWLNITPAGPYNLQITEVMDFELNAIRNRIWYRGDGNEIEQMYQQSPEYADQYKFWASKSTPGMEMRKIHSGLPGLIVQALVNIVVPDMNDFEFKEEKHHALWEEIDKENKLRRKLKKALSETLVTGDGAWKILINKKVSPYPLVEWYPGDRVELHYRWGRVDEVVFKTPYRVNHKQYVLHEHYGYGYLTNHLYCDDKEVPLDSIEETKNLSDFTFNDKVILAIPMMIFESRKFEGRGGSIFDGKQDSFDALDEAWSQWMDALRAGRTRTYIPESLIPRDPKSGKLIRPNAFDNRFIETGSDMREKGQDKITTEQAGIPHDSYQATYVTALDLCLQGIISPSTLGIDVKKLDNAEAQREKEKATLYTRNSIIEELQEVLPKLIAAVINANQILNEAEPDEVDVDVPFGEYANPSFESQIETVAKGKQGGILSVEAAVEELYGSTKDETWKKEEVARLKEEQGIAQVEEPAVNLSAGSFNAEVIE